MPPLVTGVALLPDDVLDRVGMSIWECWGISARTGGLSAIVEYLLCDCEEYLVDEELQISWRFKALEVWKVRKVKKIGWIRYRRIERRGVLFGT